MQIDTEVMAKQLTDLKEWTPKDFEDGTETPNGWSYALIDVIPRYEEAMYKDVVSILEQEALDTKAIRAEVVRRFIKNEENCSLADSLEWFEDQQIITTRKAFQLASQDKTVIQLFADGTDTELEDCAIENEYFPDKSKSYPNVETIFLTEKK